MKDESEPAKRVNAPEPLVRAADRAELQRCLAAYKVDPSSSIPWDEVRASLFKGQG